MLFIKIEKLKINLTFDVVNSNDILYIITIVMMVKRLDHSSVPSRPYMKKEFKDPG